MGKYRLRSRKEDAVITLMEVDTESHSWYIQADDEEGALAVLREMAGEINCLVHIYLNGKEVGDQVFPVKIENRSVAYNFRLRNYPLSHHHTSAASSCPPRCPCSPC